MENNDARLAPSLFVTMLIWGTTLALYALLSSRCGNFSAITTDWFDNQSYVRIAEIIQNRSLGQDPDIPHHFWGLPYLIDVVTLILPVPKLAALVLISVLASAGAVVITHLLYGGWIATAFSVVSFWWLELSLKGGSEPLFMLALYAGFLLFRSGHPILAVLTLSLSSTVRPVGIIVILLVLIELLRRRAYRDVMISVGVSLVIGVAYVAPLAFITGDALFNYHAYSAYWGPTSRPLTVPFLVLAPSMLGLMHGAKPTVWIPTLFWIIVSISALCVAWIKPWHGSQIERGFLSIYMLFLLSYNYVEIAADFPRFMLPTLPLVILAFESWLPRKIWMFGAVGVISALMASASTIGSEQTIRCL